MKNEDSKNGGRRPGSGRKVGSGLYKEDTTVIRIPTSQKPVISDFLEAYAKRQQRNQHKESLDNVGEFAQPSLDLHPVSIPLYQSKVPAGLPAPAESDLDSRMDPNRYLIDRENDTFFVTIQGESMLEVGLMPGDKAVVVKGKLASVGDIVLAMIDGEFTIKTLAKQKDGNPKLLPANSSGKYSPILIEETMQFEIWGVVTGSFRKF